MTETALSRRTFVIASAAAGGVVVGLRCAALAPAEMGERTYTSLVTDAQVESAVHYGLTAAMYGEIGIQSGRAAQSNFHDYECFEWARRRSRPTLCRKWALLAAPVKSQRRRPPPP